ncbi:YcxB family protein [Sphingomonas sp. KR3-1]|uniref:YcxB family protein n=1 Tax=Sphingomonas sp. KR3-1 TaxID=3156611 RepID=UPI0032B3851B
MAIVHDEPATSVTYVLGEEPQIAAAKAHLWRYMRSRRGLTRMAIGIPIMLVLGAVLGLALGEDPLWWMLIFAVEIVLLVPLIYLLLFPAAPRRIRRLVSQSPIWKQPVTVTWSAAGLSSDAAVGTTALAWADYHAWHKAPAGFLLYFNDLQYQVIPASALAPGQMDGLRAILERSGLRRF